MIMEIKFFSFSGFRKGEGGQVPILKILLSPTVVLPPDFIIFHKNLTHLHVEGRSKLSSSSNFCQLCHDMENVSLSAPISVVQDVLWMCGFVFHIWVD